MFAFIANNLHLLFLIQYSPLALLGVIPGLRNNDDPSVQLSSKTKENKSNRINVNYILNINNNYCNFNYHNVATLCKNLSK